MAASKPIVVIGSSNTDMMIRVPRLPKPGETILGGEFRIAAGGKGANQAFAAARAGGDVKFIGRVGIDTFGERALMTLKQEGVDVRGTARDKHAPSGAALIYIAKNGENSIAVAGGANSRLSSADVRKAAGAIARAAAVLLQLEIPLEAVRDAARFAADAAVPVILNPAPARPLPAALLKLVSIITPNESEAELLTGIEVKGPKSAAEASRVLRSRGARSVVLTMGARGALLCDAAGCRVMSGFAVEAVDTTAAGDVFNGALSVALSEGRGLEQSIRFANAAAAISVTRRGAQGSAPHRSSIDSFLKRRRGTPS